MNQAVRRRASESRPKATSWLSAVALFVAAVARGENATAPFAEFSLSESLLRQFAVVSRKTTPYYDNGNRVEPDITMTAGFRLENGDGRAVTVLDLSMSGTAVTSSTRAIGRRGRHSVNVVATTALNADFEQTVELSPNGVRAGGPLRGSPEITLQGIAASNTMPGRFANRIVGRATMRRAPSEVHRAIPEKEAEVMAQASAGVSQALAQAGSALDRVLAEVQSQLASPSAFPFEPRLSSRAGGTISMRFDGGAAKASSPQAPMPPRDPQAAASTVLHEDFLVRAVTPQIAGKELRMSELRGVLCVPPEKPLLDFCAEWPKDGMNLSILFDATEPITMKFEDGKIRLRLNAIYRTLKSSPVDRLASATREAGGFFRVSDRAERAPLLRAPSDEGVQFQTQPYSIDLSYRLGKDGAQLEQVAVRDRAVDSRRTVGNGGKTGTHEDKKPVSTPGDWSRALLSQAVKTQIETAVRSGVRERIEFPSVAFPTRLSAPEPGTAGPTTVLEAGGLFPLEARSENGYLVMSQYFCREGQSPLGVQYHPTTGALVLSSVKPGSPAEAAGLRVGDRIESYGVPGERATTAGVGTDGFGTFTAGRSRGANAEARTVLLTGRDAQGRAFQRRVTVCPAEAKLRERAEALLRTARR